MGIKMPTSDSDWDYSPTNEDLRLIDTAVLAACAPSKRLPPTLSRASDDCPPRTRHRLPESLFLFQRKDTGFSLSPCYGSRFYSRTGNPTISRLPDIKFGGHIIYRRTAEEVERAAEELLYFVEAQKRKEGQCVIGLDIEWKPTFRRGFPPGKAAVMQICADNSCCFVLHIFHSQIPKSLQRLLEDPICLKVGVCIANDAAKILRDHNVSINNLADLSNLANRKLGGEPKKWSLSKLTETLIFRQLPKPNIIRLGDWEVEVLSKKQLEYAAIDAYVSWHLYQVLKTFSNPV